MEDVTTQIKAFTQFTQQALNDSNQAMSLLNFEISMMKKKQYYETHGPQYLYSISKRQAPTGRNSNHMLHPYTKMNPPILPI